MIVLMSIEDMLADLGCEAATTAPSIDKALALIDLQSFDIAMLDANLSGKSSAPIADALAARNIPFFFATGYRDNGAGGLHSDRLVLRKPFQMSDLERSFRQVLSAGNEVATSSNQ